MIKKKLRIGWLCITLIAVLFSCKKEKVLTNSSAFLYTNADTLKFDTVFTSAGSITQSFKIFNPNDGIIKLSSIKLMGGAGSPFHININGVSASELHDVEIEANDSMYVFVTVNINPQSGTLPFLVSDSILLAWNENQFFIQLEAYGQNAYFLRGKSIHSDTTWNSSLPIVILDSLVVDNQSQLTIQEGTQIFVHANAAFKVNGSLIVQGKKNQEVIFRGDRLDEYYKDIPGSWPGLVFSGLAHDNILTYAIVKNAINGINVEESNHAIGSNPTLNIHQSIIDNAQKAGIICCNNSIEADNSLISNCGQNLQVNKGGKYSLVNCTLVSYSTLYQIHNQPVISLSNAIYLNAGISTNDLHAQFQNCIIWGEDGISNNEIELPKENTAVFDVNFENCIYKSVTDLTDANFSACLQNQRPLFDTVDVANNHFNFRTTNDVASPNIDAGSASSISNRDLDDQPRLAGSAIDMGCYEKQ